MITFTSWDSELYHHGIKGQKWGVRRYQNPDGTLTAEGKAKYGYGNDLTKAGKKVYAKEYKKFGKLRDKADINLQRQNAEKYNKRATVAAKLGAKLTGASLASTIGGNIAGSLIKKEAIKNFNMINDLFSDYDFKKIVGNIRYNRLLDRYEPGVADYMMDARNKTQSVIKTGNTAAKIIGAAATVSFGIAGYNKIKEHAAKKRMSEVGHSEAVKKYKEQADKMYKMFGDVKVSDIIKKPKK